MNLKFEENKLRRNLDRSGKDYDFFRSSVNEFGEQAASQTAAEKIATLRGLYHEVNDFIRLTTKEAGQSRRTAGSLKKQPRILCFWKDMIESGMQFGDYTIINGKRYNVTGVTNVQEWNMIADISLEVVEDGVNIAL
jgi:hypothetical protein